MVPDFIDDKIVVFLIKSDPDAINHDAVSLTYSASHAFAAV